MQFTLTKLKLRKKLSAFFFDVGADRLRAAPEPFERHHR